MRRIGTLLLLAGIATLPAAASPVPAAGGHASRAVSEHGAGPQLVWWRAAGTGPRGGVYVAGGAGAWRGGYARGYAHGWGDARYVHGYGYARPVPVAPWYHPAAPFVAGAVAGGLAGAATANYVAQSAPPPAPAPTTVINNYYE